MKFVTSLLLILPILITSTLSNQCHPVSYSYTHDRIARILCPVEPPTFTSSNISSVGSCMDYCVQQLRSNCTTYTYNMSSEECYVYDKYVYNYEYGVNCISLRMSPKTTYTPPLKKGDCSVTLESWGYDFASATVQSMKGGVYINGITVLNYSSYPADAGFRRNRGVTVIIFNMEDCTIGEKMKFDPAGIGPTETTRLINYIAGLARKLILFFITTDEPYHYLSPVYGLLHSLGLPLFNDQMFYYNGKFAAVAQLGSPQNAVWDVQLQYYGPTAKISFNVSGNTLDDVLIG